jgi:hypothetical protein
MYQYLILQNIFSLQISEDFSTSMWACTITVTKALLVGCQSNIWSTTFEPLMGKTYVQELK